MTKKELVKNAYEQFYGYVENSADENGWVKREEHSGFMRNHFYLSNNIETKVVDKVEYWRPKTLEGIEDNNGWIFIKHIRPKTGEICFVFDSCSFIGIGVYCTLQKVFKTRFGNEYENITHYQPITKPNPPLWTEEK